MKEKMKQLAKGKFKYQLPNIVLSEKRIEKEIESGSIYSGSITISNDQGMEMKGVLYSSSPFLVLKEESFIGVTNCIHYEFNGKHAVPGEAIKGSIILISNCKEVNIPFVFTIEAPYLMTSMGKMRDLFHFANLAKADFCQAMNLFQSEDFVRVFLYRDEKNQLIYRSLIKSASIGHAMEEFLIAIHKKVRISIKADKIKVSYQKIRDTFMDSLQLTKDGWGYLQLDITTDVPFIQLEHEKVTMEHFIGNTFSVNFVIESSELRQGKNFGHIYIKSVYQTIAVEVEVVGDGIVLDREPYYLEKKKNVVNLQQNYLDFRTGQISYQEYISVSKEILGHLFSFSWPNLVWLELLKVHLCLMEGGDQEVKVQLTSLNENKTILPENSVVDYCGYLYLQALYSKEEKDIEEAVGVLKDYYHQGYNNWEILWYLLYLDKGYDQNPHKKWKDIYEQFVGGCSSPILYFEACSLLNEEPSLLQDLNQITIQILHWGLKRKYLGTEARSQYTYLASKCKTFQKIVFYDLTVIYDENPSQEVLSAILIMLIKGHKTENKYFYWYRLGVMERLRITELYENYMYSLDESLGEPLPQPVMLYFVYDSSLSDKKKAYLYANIIKNKDNCPSIYRTYGKLIEKFAQKQWELHNISENLAVIYEEVLTKNRLEVKTAKNLPYILFQYEITCNNKDMVGVSVIHREVEKEVYIPLINGTGRISILTDNGEIFLVDFKGNRYVTTIEYTLNRFLDLEELSEKCFEFYPENPMLLVHLFSKIEHFQKYEESAVRIRKKLLELPDIHPHYRKNCLLTLIQFYYEQYEGNQLEELLLKVDLKDFDVTERRHVIEKIIIRDLYEKAIEEVMEYGYMGIPIHRLLKLCTKIIEDSLVDEQSEIIKLAYYVFSSNKYNETIVGYLIKNYQGSSEQLVEIWKVALELGMDTSNLEERILVQILFAETYIANDFSIFLSYYRKKNNPMVVRSYLTYHSYKFLIWDRPMREEFFEIIRQELRKEENEIGTLGLLKYYSEKDKLSKEELEYIDFHIHQFVKKSLVLPFFKDFQKWIRIPSTICDKYYVQYICDPSNLVKIHYRVENENSKAEFVTEIMNNVFGGIHVKEFILFYNETLQYYISEVTESGETITESYNINPDQKMDVREDNPFHCINLMRMSREMQDEATLLELMEHYAKLQNVNARLFKVL